MLEPNLNIDWLVSELVLLTMCCSGNTGKGSAPAAPSILSLKLHLGAGIANKFISSQKWMEITNNVLGTLVVTRIEYKGIIFHILICK